MENYLGCVKAPKEPAYANQFKSPLYGKRRYISKDRKYAARHGIVADWSVYGISRIY